jgi:hypothetical protein
MQSQHRAEFGHLEHGLSSAAEASLCRKNESILHLEKRGSRGARRIGTEDIASVRLLYLLAAGT